MRYVLGTAQFGLDYGVSNTKGKVNNSEIKKILEAALNFGVDFLDTANVYGNSEEIIGKFSDLTKNFKLITKTAHQNKDLSIKENIKLIEDELDKSLVKMNRDNVDILLIHNTKEILSKDGLEIYQSLNKIKSSGKAKKIGISIYSLKELNQIIEKYSVDVIQFPVNIFNQSFSNSEILKKLSKMGLELHARSIFLQGILLMNSEDLDRYFDPMRQVHSNYQNFLIKKKLSQVEGAINFIKRINELNAVTFGVQNHAQLSQIMRVFKSETIEIEYKDFAIDDAGMTNPAKWNLR